MPREDQSRLLGELESRLKSAEAKISALESRVKDTEAFDGRIKTLDGRITDAWNVINDLTKKVNK